MGENGVCGAYLLRIDFVKGCLQLVSGFTKITRREVIHITITKLAKMAGITRPTLYKYLDKKGYDKKNLNDDVISEIIDYFSKRTESNRKVVTSSKKSSLKKTNSNVVLPNLEKETIKERLANAKSDYNFNSGIIARLKNEIDQYVNENETTTFINSSGSTSVIPQISQLEKYIKLNISLNKSIQELEQALDIIKMSTSIEDNPFE